MPKTLELKPIKSSSSYKVEIYLDKISGTGASCTVFLGKRNSLDVIVKKMASKDLAKIEREQARYNELTNISRNHTLVAFDIYTDDDGFLYKIQQINDGKIWDTEQCPVENYTLYDTLLITKSLLEVVDKFHQNNTLLMDITPDNIFVQENEHRVMLFDLDASVDINGLGKLKRISSKPIFAPWEIASFKKRHIGAWSDLYMVANCLYYRLFEQPFDINNHRYLPDINFSNSGKFKDHNQIFGDQKALLISFFQKALKFEIKDRFQTAGEMLEAVDEIIDTIINPNRLENNFSFAPVFTVGRDQNIEDMRKTLLLENVIALNGIGGLGKSHLATYYAQKYRQDYDAIIKIPYDKESLFSEIIDDSVVEITNYTKESVIDSKKSQEKSPEELNKLYFEQKMQKLSSLCNENILLILDGMNNRYDENLQEICLLGCHVIITSREDFSAINCVSNKNFLTNISMEDLEKLFYHHYKLQVSDKQVVRDIITAVAGHILTVELIAKSALASDIDLHTLLENITNVRKKYPQENIDFELNGQLASNTVDEIIGEIFNMSKLTEAQKYVLKNLCLFPDTGINRSFFKEWTGFDTLNDVNDLTKSGWITFDAEKNAIALHQVIADVCLKKLKPDGECCKKLVQNITKNISFCMESNEKNAIYNEIQNIQIYMHIAQNFYKPTLNALKLLMLLGDFSFEYLIADECEKSYNKSLDIALEMYPDKSNVVVGHCYQNLGKLNFSDGFLDESIEMYHQAIRIYLAICKGTELEKNLALLYINEAITLFALEIYDLAIKGGEEAIKYLKSVHKGADSVDLARAYRICARSLFEMKKHRKAKRYMKKALAMFERKAGKDASITKSCREQLDTMEDSLKNKKKIFAKTKNEEDDGEYVTIIDENNREIKVEVIHYFTLALDGNDYLVYTNNNKDEDSNVLVFISQVIEYEDKVELKGIESEEILREITKILEELSETKIGNFAVKED